MSPRAELIERLRFRRFEERDLDSVRGLHIAALEGVDAYISVDNYYQDLDHIQSHYLASGGEFLVGELNGEIVAMGGISPRSETTVELRRMRVKPALQGEGIGRHLLAMLEVEVAKRGFTVVELDTTVNQVPAQRLFETAGYAEIGRGSKGGLLESIFYRKTLQAK